MGIPTASLFSASAMSAATPAAEFVARPVEAAKPAGGSEAGKSFASTLQTVSRRPQGRQDASGSHDPQAGDASDHSSMDRPSTERTAPSPSDDSGSSAQASAQRPASDEQHEFQETDSSAADTTPLSAGNDPVNQSLLLAMLAAPMGMSAPQPVGAAQVVGQTTEATEEQGQAVNALMGMTSSATDASAVVPEAPQQAVDAKTPVMTDDPASLTSEDTADMLHAQKTPTASSMQSAAEPVFTAPTQEDSPQAVMPHEPKPAVEQPVMPAASSESKEPVSLQVAPHDQTDGESVAKNDHPRGLERAEQVVGRPVGELQRERNGALKEGQGEEDRPEPVHASLSSALAHMAGEGGGHESAMEQEFTGRREREQAQDTAQAVVPQAPSLPASTQVSYAGVSTGAADARAATAVPAAQTVPLTAPQPLSTDEHVAAPGQSRSVVLEVAQSDLGHLNIRVALNQERVHTFMTSDRAEVGQFLASGQEKLQAAFQQAGLDMGQFRVDLQQQGAGRSFQQQMFQGQSHGQSHGQSFYGNAHGQGQSDGHESGADQHRRQGLLSLVA